MLLRKEFFSSVLRRYTKQNVLFLVFRSGGARIVPDIEFATYCLSISDQMKVFTSLFSLDYDLVLNI